MPRNVRRPAQTSTRRVARAYAPSPAAGPHGYAQKHAGAVEINAAALTPRERIDVPSNERTTVRQKGR